MKIKEVNIKNFRGIEDLTLKLNDFTVLIGKNGVGKSSVLHALNFFKEQSYKIKSEDYFNKDLECQIEVSITFFDLSKEEKEVFKAYIQKDELKVIKIATAEPESNNPQNSQKYHGLRKVHRPFKEIRDLYSKSKTDMKKKYKELIQQEKYNDLPKIGNKSADLIEGYFNDWEVQHSDELELIMDSGQFFGWTGVGLGKLNKFMEFFFIPAVHEYSEEEKAEESSYLNELLNLTIRKTFKEPLKLVEFKEKAQEDYKNLISGEIESSTITLSNELTKRLDYFAPDCKIFINYQPGDIKFTNTRYGTELEEFGFRGPISYLGHGVQRSFFFTILQYLGEQRLLESIETSTSNEDNLDSTDEVKFLILLIVEEPELYQHPNRIKLIKKVFQNLTLEKEKSSFQFQIICSSHSPNLIDIQSANNIRLLRKERKNSKFNVSVKEIDLNIIAQKLKEFWEYAEEKKFDEVTLTSRLIPIMTSEVSEGFFADKIVLVEGLEEKAVFHALDHQLNTKKFDEKGTIIIPALGKRNLDRPALIFKELGIPTYLIFDTDSDKKDKKELENHRKCNIVLRKIMGDDKIKEPFDQRINANWAALNPNLTFIIKNSIEDDYYNQEMTKLRDLYGFPSIKDCKKNYKVIEDFITICYKDEKKIPVLEQIIKHLNNL